MAEQQALDETSAAAEERRPRPLDELDLLKEAYDIAEVFVAQALCFEEAGRPGEALEMYYKAHKYINDGLKIQCEHHAAHSIRTKLNSRRDDVQNRIYALSSEKNPPKFAPPYSTTGSANSDHVPSGSHDTTGLSSLRCGPNITSSSSSSSATSSSARTATPAAAAAMVVGGRTTTRDGDSMVDDRRLNGLREAPAYEYGATPTAPTDAPPSYVEATAPLAASDCVRGDTETDRQPVSASTAMEVFSNTAETQGQSRSANAMMQMSARQLVHIPGGVQVFHIGRSGEVTVTSDPGELFIFTLSPAYRPVSQQTVSWLQAGEFTYPLVPGRSPVLKTGYGAYMFPDVDLNGESSSTVALVLSADVTLEMRDILDYTLREYACFEEQPQIRAEDISYGQKVSDTIMATSELVSRGLVRGAQATSVALNYGAEKLRERMTPEQRAFVVDPRVQTGLKIARATTSVTCKATGFVVSAVGDMACALGRNIAKSLASTSAVDGVAANSTLNNALLIAGGGIAGFGTVFMGLETAARLLAGSITENTVTLVHHKYGGNAGEVVGDALHSVGNLALTANNVANLGVRGIAKKTAKETGKAMLREYAQTGTPLPNQDGRNGQQRAHDTNDCGVSTAGPSSRPAPT